MRSLELADAPLILALLSDPQVSRFFLWEPPRTLEQARRYVAGFRREMALRWAYHFAVEQHATGELLGVANLYHIDALAREAEIGLWLGQPYWGRGFQREASRLLLAFGFRKLRLERLLFRVAVENQRAQSAFQKLGAVEWGRVRLYSRPLDQMVEHLILGVTAADWREKGDPP